MEPLRTDTAEVDGDRWGYGRVSPAGAQKTTMKRKHEKDDDEEDTSPNKKLVQTVIDMCVIDHCKADPESLICV